MENINISFGNMVFEGLKLKKEAGLLPWNNKTECNKYFDEKVEENNEFSKLAVKNAVIMDYTEDIHIILSNMFIYKYASMAIISIALLLMLGHFTTAALIFGGISLVAMVISFLYKRKLNIVSFSLQQVEVFIEILFYTEEGK